MSLNRAPSISSHVSMLLCATNNAVTMHKTSIFLRYILIVILSCSTQILNQDGNLGMYLDQARPATMLLLMMTYSQRWLHPKLAGNIIWDYRPQMQKLTTEGEEA